MSEFGFDLRSGELLVGAEAIEQRTIEAGPDVVPLQKLLAAPEPPPGADSYAKMDTPDWEPDDYLNYGRWLLTLTPGEPTLKRDTVRRMHILGLGPSSFRLVYNFSQTMSGFKEALGIPHGNDRLRYAHWGIADFVAYASSLVVAGEPPTVEDITAAFRKGEGPSHKLIYLRIGSHRALLELLGYPHIQSWDEDDFINWGVMVCEANPDKPLTRFVSNALKSKRRGPLARTITRHFGRWNTFTEKVAQRRAEKQTAQQQRLERYYNLVAQGSLPEAVIELPIPQILAIGGRYRVASACLSDAGASRLQTVALSPKSLISAIRKAAPYITAGYIETQAMVMGVFDDIWPPHQLRDGLVVSDEELALARQKDRDAKRRERARALGATAL